MTCGHYILKLSNVPGYDSATILSSLQVGALGGLLMAIPMMILEWITMNLQSCSFHTFQFYSKDTDDGSTTDPEGTIVEKETHTGQPHGSIAIGVIQILLSVASVTGLGAGTGYFGSAVLNATGHDVLGVLEATRAGAVGAAILGPGVLILVLLLLFCCGSTAILALLFARWRDPDAHAESKTEKLPDAKV